MVASQFNASIKVLRFGNRLEVTLQSSFSSKGVIHQLSFVETPQQNSIVERKHQHLLNAARSLRFQANLPLKFWGDCILTTTYLINRALSPLFDNKTPFEKLLGYSPSYSHLSVLGCLCYASTHSRHRTKFDPRVKASILFRISIWFQRI